MATVPTLGNTLYLRDPARIIAYTIRKFFYASSDVIPDLGSYIISLPDLKSRFASNPDSFTLEIRNALQGCFNRIFQNERTITVAVSYTLRPNQTDYDVSIVVAFTKNNGDIDTVSSGIQLINGRLVIPEDDLSGYFS